MRSMDGLPTYSTVEVSKHATADDAWIIVSGKILDVTSWLDEHPGGDDVLLDFAGRDATREFEDVGHSADAHSRLDTLIIGTLRPSTAEELRISPSEGAKTREAVDSVVVSRTVVSDWLHGHISALRRIGTIGLAGAIVIGAVTMVRRYAKGFYAWERR